MKNLMYISGIVTSIATLFGALLIIMEWEFGFLTGGILLTFGIFGITLVFIPTFAVYNYRRTKY